MHVLLLGATGYLGGRVVPGLLAAGHRVRCAVRTPEKLDGRPWRADVEVVRGDVTDPADMAAACADVDVSSTSSAPSTAVPTSSYGG